MFNDAALSASLSIVGLSRSGEFSVGESIAAVEWESDYAQLLLVDAEPKSVDELNALLSQLDIYVAKKLRTLRAQGKQVEAHVCIVVKPSVINDERLKSESVASRFVSRKYWIPAEHAVKEILARLTLAWVNPVSNVVVGALEIPEDLIPLRVALRDFKGAGAANAIIGGEDL